MPSARWWRLGGLPWPDRRLMSPPRLMRWQQRLPIPLPPWRERTVGPRRCSRILLTEAAGAQVVATAVADSRRRGAALAVGWPPLRWVARLRPDPVVRWRLDRSDVAPELVRTSLPGSDPVAAARARTAVLTYADTASQGAPRAWVDSTRDVAESIADSLPDALDRAVTCARCCRPAILAGGEWSAACSGCC